MEYLLRLHHELHQLHHICLRLEKALSFSRLITRSDPDQKIFRQDAGSKRSQPPSSRPCTSVPSKRSPCASKGKKYGIMFYLSMGSYRTLWSHNIGHFCVFDHPLLRSGLYSLNLKRIKLRGLRLRPKVPFEKECLPIISESFPSPIINEDSDNESDIPLKSANFQV